MSQGLKTIKGLGYIFGLGAFRRYTAVTGGDVGHFDEALLSADKIGVVEANHRWAVMLKCAHDVYLLDKGGEGLSVDQFEQLLDNSPQEDSDELVRQYMDSNFMGKKMREYYGIPEPEKETAKKKRSVSAKPSRPATKSATGGAKSKG